MCPTALALIAEQASWVQRMQKALVSMNIQHTEMLSNVMGTTGQAIIRAIVAGERNPLLLALYRHSRVEANEQHITRAPARCYCDKTATEPRRAHQRGERSRAELRRRGAAHPGRQLQLHLEGDGSAH